MRRALEAVLLSQWSVVSSEFAATDVISRDSLEQPSHVLKHGLGLEELEVVDLALVALGIEQKDPRGMVEDTGRIALGPHSPGGDDRLDLRGRAGQKMPGGRVGAEEPGIAVQDLGRVALGVERDRDELDRGSPELGLLERSSESG